MQQGGGGGARGHLMKVEDKKSDKLVDLWWLKIPVASLKISNMFLGIFADGLFVTAWPKFAKIAPPSIFVIGLLIGGFHLLVDETSETFTSSIPLMALMLILSSFSAALGTWLWAGYVLGDFVLYPLMRINTSSFADGLLLHDRSSLVVAYLLFAMLLIVIPYVSSVLRRQTLRRIDRDRYRKAGIILNVVLQATIYGALVYVWTQAVPTLIRPVYTWQGTFSVPPVEAIQPLQQEWVSLVWLAIFMGAIRMVLEYLALRNRSFIHQAKHLQEALDSPSSKRRRSLPLWISIPFKAAFLTLIFSGIISTWTEAIFLATIIAFLMIVREIILPRFARWTRWVASVPIIIRLAICAVISYYIGSQIVLTFWNDPYALSSSCSTLVIIPCEAIFDSSNTFSPIVFSIIFSLIIASVILPRQSEKSKVRSDQRHQ
jgi:hypothetical protein